MTQFTVRFTVRSLFFVIVVGAATTVHAFSFNLAGFFRGLFDDTVFYGDGSDSTLTVSGVPNGPTNPLVVNTTVTYLSADAAAAATSLSVNSSSGFSSGNEVLIIEMEGTNAGKMEFKTLSSTGAGSLSFATGIKNAYTSANKVQVIKVMRYSSVTINSGGFVTVSAYNSANGTGGVAVIKVSGTLTINDGGAGLAGHISTGGGYSSFVSRGFAGGSSGSGSGPGGGSSNSGGTNTSPGSDTRLVMGSGGGSVAHTGGRGGGVIIVKANAVDLKGGSIRADGAAAAAGNAGGGAGGTIAIWTNSLTSSTSCGTISASSGAGAGTGTAGGNGRIFINYSTTLGCSSSATPTSTSTYQKFKLK